MVFGLGPVVPIRADHDGAAGAILPARVVYGLSLSPVALATVQNFAATHPAGATAEQVQTFAEATFIQFAGARARHCCAWFPLWSPA